MKLNILKTVFIVALCLYSVWTNAQIRHEVSVYGGGGLSTLDYKLHNINEDDVNYRPGGLIGIGYTLFFTQQWGITTGAEFTTYRSKSEHYSLMDTYQTVDDYNDSFDFVIQQKGYTEKQKATYVNIPIMVQFQSHENSGFYAALGGKIGIPVDGEYKYSYNSLVTKAYYPHENVWYDDLDFRGIGQFGGSKGKGDLDFKVTFMLSAEAGMKWSLGKNMSLYSGAYADYGLNDMVKGGKQNTFLPYNLENPKDLKNNSILNSKYSHYWDNDKSFSSKVKSLAVGIKIRLAFSM